jgi:hypothetical protein
MTTAKHGRADVHEVCDAVIAIANEFMQVVCDERLVAVGRVSMAVTILWYVS